MGPKKQKQSNEKEPQTSANENTTLPNDTLPNNQETQSQEQKKLFMNEYLNFPGKELNVPIIQSNKFFKKNNETSHIGL